MRDELRKNEIRRNMLDRVWSTRSRNIAVAQSQATHKRDPHSVLKDHTSPATYAKALLVSLLKKDSVDRIFLPPLPS